MKVHLRGMIPSKRIIMRHHPFTLYATNFPNISKPGVAKKS